MAAADSEWAHVRAVLVHLAMVALPDGPRTPLCFASTPASVRDAISVATVLLLAALHDAPPNAAVQVAQSEPLGALGAARDSALLSSAVGSAETSALRALVTAFHLAASSTTVCLASVVGLRTSYAPVNDALLRPSRRLSG
jgi:hypothetical protein